MYKDSRKKIFWFALICAVNLIIFWPSFSSQLARHDHLHYLANRTGQESWFSLAVSQSFSYTRREAVWAERDTLLFRPLFYFILGSEYYFFKYHFVLWQVTGFLLHLLVVWCLLSLLWRIHPGLLATAAALVFSTMYANVEMVIWHNISSYMIYVSCIAGCFNLFYQIMEKREIDASQAWRIFGFLGIACFLYEVGFLMAFFFFAVALSLPVGIRGRASFFLRHWKLAVFLPGLLSLITNLTFFFAKTAGLTGGKVFAHATPAQICQAIGMSAGWWFTSGLFPWLLKPALGERVIFYYNGAFLEPKTILGGDTPLAVLGLLAVVGGVAAYLFFSARGISTAFLRQRAPFLLLVIGAWIIHGTTIAIGRQIWADTPALANSSYYSYFFWFYLIIILYSLIHFRASMNTRHIFNPRTCLLVFCFIFAAIGAFKIFILNQRYCRIFQKRNLVLAAAKQLINSHRDEKDFSFATDNISALDMPFLEKSPPVRSEEPYDYLQMIYPMFFRRENPKYIITIPGEKAREADVAFIEAGIENFIEPPILTWDDRNLSLLIALLQVYGAYGENDKAVHLIDRIVKTHPLDPRLRMLLTDFKQQMKRM